MRCTVVIPAYNNEAVVGSALAAINSQVVPSGWDLVIVVADDGSTDATVAAARTACRQAPWPMEVIEGPHTGAAGARNRGAAAVDSGIILFLGADILLRPGALASHLEFHSRYPDPHAAALGFVQWDPRLMPSPLMEWMVHGGPQNDFDALLGKATANPAHYFYGSHLSLKREVLGKSPFCEGYRHYGWEDLDLGRVLEGRGLELRLLPKAVGLHHHHYSARAVARRQHLIGRGLVLYQKRYPAVPLLPRGSVWRRFRRTVAAVLHLDRLLARLLDGKKWPWLHEPLFFQALCSISFWRGVYSTHRGVDISK